MATLTSAGVTFGDATTQSTAAVVNTTTVLSATAGATAGAVGTYAFLYRSTSVTPGTTYAGSGLLWGAVALQAGCGFIGTGATAQSGTWRCLGNSTSLPQPVTLYLRIS